MEWYPFVNRNVEHSQKARELADAYRCIGLANPEWHVNAPSFPDANWEWAFEKDRRIFIARSIAEPDQLWESRPQPREHAPGAPSLTYYRDPNAHWVPVVSN